MSVLQGMAAVIRRLERSSQRFRVCPTSYLTLLASLALTLRVTGVSLMMSRYGPVAFDSFA